MIHKFNVRTKSRVEFIERRALEEVDITWLVQGPKPTEVDAAAGRFRLIVMSTADNKGCPAGNSSRPYRSVALANSDDLAT